MFAFPNNRNIDLLVALDDVIAINVSEHKPPAFVDVRG